MQYEIHQISASPQVDFPKVLRWTPRDFVARGRPLRCQTRLAPLAKRSTYSKSSPQEQTNDPVVDLSKNMKRQIDLYCPGGGGRRVLPYLAHVYGYVPLNRLWFQGVESFKNRVYNFTIERLERDVFLDWKPFKESEDLR